MGVLTSQCGNCEQRAGEARFFNTCADEGARGLLWATCQGSNSSSDATIQTRRGAGLSAPNLRGEDVSAGEVATHHPQHLGGGKTEHREQAAGEVGSVEAKEAERRRRWDTDGRRSKQDAKVPAAPPRAGGAREGRKGQR